MLAYNQIILAVLTAIIVAQASKVITRFVEYKKFKLLAFLDMGGMPSGHSAFVSALTASVGIVEGFTSTIFLVSLVFSIVVMYDAMGIRQSAENQGRALNKILKMHKIKSKKLKEDLGHSPLEVAVGVIIGVAFAILFTLS